MDQPQLPKARPTLFTRMFGATRYVMTVASLFVFIGATVLLVVGIIEMAAAVWKALTAAAGEAQAAESVSVRVAVTEAVDVILVKYWLEETMADQTARFEERISDPRKIWKLSPMDLESHRRWYDCLAHLLSLIPYAEVPHEKIKLPKRQSIGDYIEPDYPFRRIPAKY